MSPFRRLQGSCKARIVEEGIDGNYAATVKEAHTGCSTEINLLTNPFRIPQEKGVKQGCPLSPKLFTACFEMVLSKMNWKDEIIVNNERHHNLRQTQFANTSEMKEMLQELNPRNKEVGHKKNMTKMKVMHGFNMPKAKLRVDGSVQPDREVNVYYNLQLKIAHRKVAEWHEFFSNTEFLKRSSSGDHTGLFNTLC